jgi:hypothetical protein
VTVNTNATLSGVGTIGGVETVQSGGTLRPGLGGVDTSTLSVSSSLSLAGATVMVLNRTSAQNSSRVAAANFTAGGTLTVNNAGPALQGGDTFVLFTTAPTGGFAATNLPAVGAGQNWWTTNNHATLVLNQVSAGTASYTRGKDGSLKIIIADLLTNVTSLPAGGDSFALAGVGASTNGATITSDGTNLFYFPANNLEESFTYSVTDSRGGGAVGAISIQVAGSVGPTLGTNALSIAGGVATVNAWGIPGYAYALQTTTNLPGPWWPVATNTAAANGALHFMDPNASNTTQFYRLAQP